MGVGLAIAYGVVGVIGLRFATYQENATLIWPASGLALATLLLYGRWLP